MKIGVEDRFDEIEDEVEIEGLRFVIYDQQKTLVELSLNSFLCATFVCFIIESTCFASCSLSIPSFICNGEQSLVVIFIKLYAVWDVEFFV